METRELTLEEVFQIKMKQNSELKNKPRWSLEPDNISFRPDPGEDDPTALGLVVEYLARNSYLSNGDIEKWGTSEAPEIRKIFKLNYKGSDVDLDARIYAAWLKDADLEYFEMPPFDAAVKNIKSFLTNVSGKPENKGRGKSLNSRKNLKQNQVK